MARIRAIERFVAEREVGDDVPLDGGLEQRPLEPRRIAQVAALDRSTGAKAQPDQDIAAEAFHESHAFAPIVARRRNIDVDRPGGQPIQDLLDPRETLANLANPNPDPRVK